MTPKRRPAGRYTDAIKAETLRILTTDGLPAAAKHSGAAKSTILGWAKAAGITPDQYAERSTAQNEAAARASVAARRVRLVEDRARLSDELVAKLAPRAVELIAARLEEQAEADERVRAATEELQEAIEALKVATQPDDPQDPRPPEVAKAMANEAKVARTRVTDAAMILKVERTGRATIPELVGVFTRSIGDHLSLEGDATDNPVAGSFTIIQTAPQPARRPPDVVTLDPEPTPTGAPRT